MSKAFRQRYSRRGHNGPICHCPIKKENGPVASHRLNTRRYTSKTCPAGTIAGHPISCKPSSPYLHPRPSSFASLPITLHLEGLSSTGTQLPLKAVPPPPAHLRDTHPSLTCWYCLRAAPETFLPILRHTKAGRLAVSICLPGILASTENRRSHPCIVR